ncbi:MAG: glycerophosphodiester phosphodiesterase [Candidatus Hermodarchaeota archaeon]
MNKPYIFAHRGAMGYCIENTIDSFQKAVEMKVGIETDVQITKDKNLVCFHDPAFKIEDKYYSVNDLSLMELRSLKFKDKREIPTLKEVFDTFGYCPKNFRYSIDIINREAGLALIDIVKKFSNFNQVEVTDTRIYILKKLRKNNEKIKLVHTVPSYIKRLTDHTMKYEKLIQSNVNVLNIKIDQLTKENFVNIIKNGFKCYVWDVNLKSDMKKALKIRENGEFVRAIYSNYPDLLKKLRERYFN